MVLQHVYWIHRLLGGLKYMPAKSESVNKKKGSNCNFFSYDSVSVPPAAHDPDKPIFTALGFLGKLPGGKCLK